ncbi:MAG: glucan biosynthesis protein G [Gammaproteobacteria bacterium]|nr:MAG: glucan biosynthesis protein G [Gammaproteobacteria bacterium]
MNRRDFVAGGLLGATMLGQAIARENNQVAAADTTTQGKIHDFAKVVDLASSLSKESYQSDRLTLSGVFADLDYDHYRGIRFRRDADPLSASNHDFSMDLLPPGQLYQDRVRIYLVDKKQLAKEILFSSEVFDFDSNLFPATSFSLTDEEKNGLGWSGFRLRFPINNDETDDEFVVFQGASYFRAVARDTLYGLSARGLAIKTGDPAGEEFPRFSRFWIYVPATGAHAITVDALLESPSVTGAYRFEIYPGAETLFNVTCQLFPRKTLEKYGIAPLTSMYYFSPTRRYHIDDYRNAVHDSEGLAIHTGREARLWRPLANPEVLQFSAFMDNNPKGFGLIQRARQFNHYQDAEARYEKRPSVWVKPLSAWMQGSVALVEIPTDNEFNDNVITFWQGSTALEQGMTYRFAYQLIWSQRGVRCKNRAQVAASRIGQSVNGKDTYTINIDYRFKHPVSIEALRFSPTASQGEILSTHLLLLDEPATVRASFDYRPVKGELAELQANLVKDGHIVTETWLYRWTN